MLLNILMNVWFFGYMLFAGVITYQIFKGNPTMSWRETGFFIFGLMFGAVPFYWIITLRM
jgi:hypothetical protein